MTYPGQQPSSAAPPEAYTVPPPLYPYPAVAPDGRPLASFGDRFVARIIDTLIAAGVGFVLMTPLMIVMIWAIVTESTSAMILFVFAALGVSLISIAFGYWYEVELQLKNGQTYGKRVTKIQVAPIAPGHPLTRGMLAKRWLIWSVAGGFVPLLIWLDGLWQLWDKPYQQCLHDKFAETVVVKVTA